MQKTIKFKSVTKNYIVGAGGGTRWRFDGGEIDQKGPNGGRLLLKNIRAVITLNLTIATASLLGEDLYRFADTVTVKQKFFGMRFKDVPGYALRTWTYETLGAKKVNDHPDAVVGTANVTAQIPITFERPFLNDEDQANQPGAFYLPADELEAVEIGQPTSGAGGSLSLGTSVVTVNSGTCYLIYECVEAVTMDASGRPVPLVRGYACDEVSVRPFDTQLESDLPTGGRLQDLILFIPGAQGGADLSQLTEAWISSPTNIAPELALSDLQQHYAQEREVAASSAATKGVSPSADPFVTSTVRACAVLLSTGIGAWEQPETERVHVVTKQGTNLSLYMISRVVKPRNDELQGQIIRKYKKSGRWRIVTNQIRAFTAAEVRYMPVEYL